MIPRFFRPTFSETLSRVQPRARQERNRIGMAGILDGIYSVGGIQRRPRMLQHLTVSPISQVFFKRTTVYVPVMLVGAYFSNQVRWSALHTYMGICSSATWLRLADHRLRCRVVLEGVQQGVGSHDQHHVPPFLTASCTHLSFEFMIPCKPCRKSFEEMIAARSD